MSWHWPKLDEKGLARYITRDAVNWLRLPVNRLDLIQQPDGLHQLVEAIYNALIEKQIRYAQEAYQPDEPLQIIRKPSEILESPGEGTCLDLATLFCGLCMGYELLPTIIVIEGHALAAVSLEHQRDQWAHIARESSPFATGLLNSARPLIDLIDRKAYIAVECTGFAHSASLPLTEVEGEGRTNGYLSLEQALIAGRKQLEHPQRPFRFAFDVAFAQDGWKFHPHTIPEAGSTYARLAREGLYALVDLIQQVPEVKDVAKGWLTVFQIARSQIGKLMIYKGIHDQLHQLQYRCYNCIINEQERFPEPETLMVLTDHRYTLQEIINELQDTAQSPDSLGQVLLTSQDGAWIQTLIQAEKQLEESIDERSKDQLLHAVGHLRRVLSRQPSRFNYLIQEAASVFLLEDSSATLPIAAANPAPTIGRALSSLRDILTQNAPDLNRVHKFVTGIDALDSLNRTLIEVLREHNAWQHIDLELRQIEVYLGENDYTGLEQSWHYVEELAKPFCFDESIKWAKDLNKFASALNKALVAKNQEQIEKDMQNYWRQAGVRFRVVDTSLKRLCADLSKIGEPISAVLQLLVED